MNPIIKAINFAEEAHCGQFRKNGTTPFIVHPLRVYSIIENWYWESPSTGLNVKIAAVLHDVIEDTKYTKEDISAEFGDDVANLVWQVTKEGHGKQGHKDYCAKLKLASEDAVSIKYADILDNIYDLDFKDTKFCNYFFNKVGDYLLVLPRWSYFTQEISKRLLAYGAFNE